MADSRMDRLEVQLSIILTMLEKLLKQNTNQAKTVAEISKGVEEINNFLPQNGKNSGDNSTSRNCDKSFHPTENSGIEKKSDEQMEEIKLKLAESQVLTSSPQIVSTPPTETPKFQLHIRYRQFFFEDPFGDLTKLQLTRSVREYQLQFEELLNCVGRMSIPSRRRSPT
jgi:uncharacterized coiled-coil protein SlyX